MKTVIFGVAIALAILGAGAIMVEREITFINMPLFLMTLFLIGAGMGFIIRGGLMKLSYLTVPDWVNISVFALLFTAVAGGAALLWNSFGADEKNMEEREVIVERKIIKTRHKTQTTGRHTYSTGAPYHVYYLELKFPDGRKMEIQPKYDVYKKSEKGDTALIRVGRGALMMNVCEPKSLRLKHPPLKRKRFGFGYGNRRRKL